MYVYIWKSPDGTPFYVGCTRSIKRTNPRNEGSRNWLCIQKIKEIDCDNIIVELRHVTSAEEGRALEKKLIGEYGRISLSTGTLTNLRVGGEGLEPMSESHKQKLREASKGRKMSPETKAKHSKRMKDPDVQAKIRGENNPAKRPEVREKIKAKWREPEFRAARTKERTGKKLHTEEHKQVLRQRLLDPDNPMREYHKILNSDPIIKQKRLAGLAKAQDKIKSKLAEPERKDKRLAKLRATVNSPEYKERRKKALTPEIRKKISDAKKAYWAKKRAETIS